MPLNISFNTTIALSSNSQLAISFNPNRIKFGILLILQLLSIPSFIWIFYQFGRQHHHHAILLAIVSFLFVTVELPLTQVFMFTSYVYPAF